MKTKFIKKYMKSYFAFGVTSRVSDGKKKSSPVVILTLQAQAHIAQLRSGPIDKEVQNREESGPEI